MLYVVVVEVVVVVVAVVAVVVVAVFVVWDAVECVGITTPPHACTGLPADSKRANLETWACTRPGNQPTPVLF